MANLEMFAATDDYLTEKNLSNFLTVKVILDHLNNFKHTFESTFLRTLIQEKKVGFVNHL